MSAPSLPAPDESAQETLATLGEEALLARLLALLPSPPADSGLLVGPGDDCAAVETGGSELLLLKADCLVEGVHFLPGTEPFAAGRKAMNRALSDIAAMGGTPRHALVTLAVDPGRAAAVVEGWYTGLAAAAAAVDCTIAGGETASLPVPGAVISVSLLGTVPRERCLLRNGTRVGDLIAVTGRLGGSFASGRHLDFSPRLEEARWLALHHPPTAAMDLSDGLGSDLPRLVAASGGLGYEVDLESLPRHEGVSPSQAACDGEDYELLLTFPPERFPALARDWSRRFPGLELTPIGRVATETLSPLPSGWEHHRSAPKNAEPSD